MTFEQTTAKNLLSKIEMTEFLLNEAKKNNSKVRVEYLGIEYSTLIEFGSVIFNIWDNSVPSYKLETDHIKLKNELKLIISTM